MPPILDDLRWFQPPPSPQERLHKELENTQESLFWEGPVRRSLPQIVLVVGIVALWIVTLTGAVLQFQLGALNNVWEIFKQLLVPLLLSVGLAVLYGYLNQHRLLYVGASPQTIWLVRGHSIEQHPLETIEKFELVSASHGYGTIRGFCTKEYPHLAISETEVLVELVHVADAYNLYQQLLHWHRIATQ